METREFELNSGISSQKDVSELIDILEKTPLDEAVEPLIARIQEKGVLGLNFSDFLQSDSPLINDIMIEIENKDFDMEIYFDQKVKGKINGSNVGPKTRRHYFLKYIEYIYFLQIEVNKAKKSFIMPSKDAFSYKTNNDTMPSKNPHYSADILLGK